MHCTALRALQGAEMVAEIRVVLRALNDTVFPAHNGRSVQGWLYHVINAGDPEMSASVHDAPINPCTCSELLTYTGAGDEMRHIGAGEPLALRITTLTSSMVRALEAGLAACEPETGFSITDPDGGRARTLRAMLVDAALARTHTYAEFRDMERSRHWRLHFRSRTAFERDERRMLLPLPELIFSNLTRKWNAFCRSEDDELTINVEELLATVAAGVGVSSVEDLRTEPIDGPVHERGFLGAITLSVLDDLPRSIFRQVTSLMHYGPFAGIGGRTSEGWGQVEVSW